MIDDIPGIAIELVGAVIEVGMNAAIDGVFSPSSPANDCKTENEVKPDPQALIDYIKNRANVFSPIPYDSIENDRKQ